MTHKVGIFNSHIENIDTANYSHLYTGKPGRTHLITSVIMNYCLYYQMRIKSLLHSDVLHNLTSKSSSKEVLQGFEEVICAYKKQEKHNQDEWEIGNQRYEANKDSLPLHDARRTIQYTAFDEKHDFERLNSRLMEGWIKFE